VIRRALGFALVYFLGAGAVVLAVALARAATPAAAAGDMQHAVLTTDAGKVLPAAGSCPYLARRPAATACPSPAQRLAAGSCPYLAGRAGGDCPARGGGGGSACPRAGRSSETPPADRAGRGVLLASMGPGAPLTVPADPT
jgi:hypothetical protein